MPVLRTHDRRADALGSHVEQLQALLCDADGNLFPSEEPAFAASARVTNQLLSSLGVQKVYSADELRRSTTGLPFRRTAAALAAAHGVPTVDDLEQWVEREKEVVTAHLGATLRPDREVLEPLRAFAPHLDLAVVSSSATSRVLQCLAATGLDALIPAERVFSAEDSLPAPRGKPDPAVYEFACTRLGIAPEEGLAVEDSVPGVRSAVAAGCPTIGNVQFVPLAERPQRIAELLDAGVLAVVSSWRELAGLLVARVDRTSIWEVAR